LALARALMPRPELLILDEPTRGLDPAGIHEIRELLRRLPGQRDVTVFLSSHLLSEVEQIATDTGVIRNGRLLLQGPVEVIQAEQRPRLVMAVDRPGEAVRLLRAAGWHASRPDGDRVRVDVREPADVGRINTLLVLHGLAVHYLTLERASLAGVFQRLGPPISVPAAVHAFGSGA
ncbi:MAG: AAA family ATPase, partial [Longimicrobiales bacterium]